MPSSTTLTPWQRAGHLGLVAILALGFALTLGIFVEGTYARPHCLAYGASRQLTYGGLAYPSAPIGVPGRQVATCLFVDADTADKTNPADRADRTVTGVPYSDVAPNRALALLVDVATTPLVTTPVLFALMAVGLSGLYGALGMTKPR